MKKIYNEDIIFHYTKASTAIDYILFNEQLKFNQRNSSIDPIESRNARRGILFTEAYVDKKIDKKFNDSSIEWSSKTYNGHVKAEYFFHDANWHCWDSEGDDMVCK